MNEEKICCPKFDPAPWDERVFEWNNKKFIKNKVFTLFYMPINFGSVMTRLCKKFEEVGATMVDGMLLSDHTSKWNMDLYLATDKDIPNLENVFLSGKFLSKVYEGNFKDTGKWMKDFESYTKDKGIVVQKTYMWYTTCPKCAKKYGKNYVVIVGKI
ncbi:MAG: hydrolase [Candidatus Paceibacterota bacterium]